MTTATVIIADAYREGNLIPIGTSPTTNEATEGLALLNRIVGSLFGNELGENMVEWPVPPPQRTASVDAHFPRSPAAHDLPSNVWPYPPGNVRLMCSITSATTIYLQHFPNDGAQVAFANVGMGAVTLTVDANGRRIETAATKAVTNASTTLRWMYRADTGNWLAIATLISSDELPLSTEFDDYFVAELSIRLGPRHGRTPNPGTVETRDRVLAKIRSRYRQPTAVILSGDLQPTPQSYLDATNPFAS